MRQFRANRRLSGVRRDTALSAATAGDLAAQITAAEQVGRAHCAGSDSDHSASGGRAET